MKSSSQDTEYEAIEILKEKAGRYYIRWAGVDPATNQPWKPTWEPKALANDLLVADWKEKKKKGKTLSSQRNSYRSESISYRSSASAPPSNGPTTRRESESRRKSRLSVVIPSISPSHSPKPSKKRRKTHKKSNTPTSPPFSRFRHTDRSSLPDTEAITCRTSSQKVKPITILDTQSTDSLEKQKRTPAYPKTKRLEKPKAKKVIPPESSNRPPHAPHDSPPQLDLGSPPQHGTDHEQLDVPSSSHRGIPQSQKLAPEEFFQDSSSHHTPEVEDEYSNLGLANMATPLSPIASLDDDAVVHRGYSGRNLRNSRTHKPSSSHGTSRKKKIKLDPTNDPPSAIILAEETDEHSSSSTRPSQRINEARMYEASPSPQTPPQSSYEPDATTAELIASLNDYEDSDHQSKITDYISRTQVDPVDKNFILKFVKDPLSYLADPTNEVEQFRKERNLGDIMGFELERKKVGSICLWFDLNDPAYPKYNITWEGVSGLKKFASRLFRYPPPRRDSISSASEDNEARSPGLVNHAAVSPSPLPEDRHLDRISQDHIQSPSPRPAERSNQDPPNEGLAKARNADPRANPREHPVECPNEPPRAAEMAPPRRSDLRRADKPAEEPARNPNQDAAKRSHEDSVDWPDRELIEKVDKEPLARPDKHPRQSPNEGDLGMPNCRRQSVPSQEESRVSPQPSSEIEKASPMPLDDTISGVTLDLDAGFLADPVLSQPLQTKAGRADVVSGHDVSRTPSIEPLHPSDHPSNSVADSEFPAGMALDDKDTNNVCMKDDQFKIQELEKTIAKLGNLLKGALEVNTAEYAKRIEAEKELTESFEASKKELIESFQAKLRSQEARITDLESRLRNQDIELTGQRVNHMNSQLEIDKLTSKIKSLQTSFVEGKQPARQLYDKFMNRQKQELSQVQAELNLAQERIKRIQRQKDLADKKNDELLTSFSKQNDELRAQLKRTNTQCGKQALAIEHLKFEVQDLTETEALQKKTIEELRAFLGIVPSPSEQNDSVAVHPDSNQPSANVTDQVPGQVSQLGRCSLGAPPKAVYPSLRNISSDIEEESQLMKSTAPHSSSGYSKALSASLLENGSQLSSSFPRHSCPPPNAQNVYKSIRSSLQYSSSPLSPPRFGTSLTTPTSVATRAQVPLPISSESQNSGTQHSNH
ncbi:uncharacterized protein VP01_221g2 [Puccinia sorghi]|uniref:Chromo domain-containing protein n=1 Tax=Puccinia sorghi TaxID=27349 RepID=A0A0L6V9E0_9BASI|nr:uncharacterized protein VP01_221g2 [Puccinia sorghi]